MYDGPEDYDNLVWDHKDQEMETTLNEMKTPDTFDKVETIVSNELGGPALVISPWICGGYNILYTVQLYHAEDPVLMRVSWPSLVEFPTEKTMQEAATCAFIAQRTKIPVPQLLSYDKHSTLGPFLIMERVKHWDTLCERIKIPVKDDDEPPVLDPSAPLGLLRSLWYQIARHQLQLFLVTFPRIGSFLETKKGTYEVADRPITHDMNSLVRLVNVPRCVLPPEQKTYTSAHDWYTALAKVHMAHLVFQHNDSISSEDDCRNKYVARQIFRRLARRGSLASFGFADDNWSAQSAQRRRDNAAKLAPEPSNVDSFRLWGDDFRPGNMLLDESDNIAAIIDWEYTYSAPTQFSLDPPWWLLLQSMEKWEEGMDNWTETYEGRLSLWFSAVEEAEAEEGANASAQHSLPVPISRYMRESWDTGRFWLTYAARRSRIFDSIYWKHLDQRFFGTRPQGVPGGQLWETRVHLLSERERKAMETLVRVKMEEMKERKIVNWEPEEARRHLARFLVDEEDHV